LYVFQIFAKKGKAEERIKSLEELDVLFR